MAVGNVLPAGGGASAARMAALYAGIPNSAAINTVNRQCSSGLSAVNQIANQIRAGEIDIGIGGCSLWLHPFFHPCTNYFSITFSSIGAGVESMTKGFGARAMPEGYSELVLSNDESADCLIPMGITSENVAEMYNISRETQDEFSAKTFQKAAVAQKAGLFKSEIVPVQVKWIDPKTQEEKTITVDHDDGIRDDVTAKSISGLKPAFKKGGTTTAANASQVSDGAAAILLARRSVAKKLGLPIIGKFVVAVAVGGESSIFVARIKRC